MGGGVIRVICDFPLNDIVAAASKLGPYKISAAPLAIPPSIVRNPPMPHADYADDLPLAEIPARLAALIDGERDFLANTANAASLLWHAIPDLNWCGFYFFRDGGLILGPFLGKPACVRISLKRGVCGIAARERRTFVVPDVHEFPGHIACDALSAAELVIPLVDAEDRLLGVLDLDSPTKGRFTEEEARVLETAVRILLAGSDTPWFADGIEGN